MLHKLTGMEFLNEKYENVHTRNNRYKGYHVFPNKSAVENRFLKGEPLSCFVWMVVAMKFMLHSIKTNQNEEETNVKSLSCHSVITHQKCILTIQVCSFVVLCVLMRCHHLRNALMLPYSRRGFLFQSQFTLVYSDWEVLLCDNNAPDSMKGPVYVHRPLLKMCCHSFNYML